MDEQLVPEDLRKAYSTQEILKIEKQHIVPAVTHYYEEPVLLLKEKGLS